MKVIKELLNIVAQQELDESENKIKLDPIKPRNKEGNDILRSKKNSRHYNPKTDYVRSKEKRRTQKTQDE